MSFLIVRSNYNSYASAIVWMCVCKWHCTTCRYMPSNCKAFVCVYTWATGISSYNEKVFGTIQSTPILRRQDWRIKNDNWVKWVKLKVHNYYFFLSKSQNTHCLHTLRLKFTDQPPGANLTIRIHTLPSTLIILFPWPGYILMPLYEHSSILQNKTQSDF